ncbi:hypothetical protein CDES_11280 [Corynebacterium deserti GIMN1.010]|uniref:Uncharacterized protein n=1 Tax=Corynebacterium deserti GIMN1.010 TaxID=931089 RepID=A0A0M3QA37_9CORY|nr:hypothetical protein [Corynebacterium deserti]ALC06623.1 hypothetical protein CDES_11280 [Corynebacterium deserti GIMN1.010]
MIFINAKNFIRVLLVSCLGITGHGLVACSEPLEYQDAQTLKSPTYVGFSNEAMGVLAKTDSANIFLSSADGEGNIVHRLAPTYFPSIERLGNGFIAPDEDSLVLFDASLNEIGRHDVAELGVAVQTSSAHSSNHQAAAFSFNEGTAENQYRHRIVAATMENATSIVTNQLPLALTACDDGSIRWIEFLPDSGMEDALGPGKARIMRLTSAAEQREITIDWHFENRPGSATILHCSNENAYIDLGQDSGEILKVTDSSKPEVMSILPPFAIADRGRFDYVFEEDYVAFNSSGILTRINVPKGNLVYSHALELNGDNPVSVTFDSDVAYIVVQPPNGAQDQSVYAIDLDDPTCISEKLELTGFDQTAYESRIERQGGSYIVIDTFMSIDPDWTPMCSQ